MDNNKIPKEHRSVLKFEDLKLPPLFSDMELGDSDFDLSYSDESDSERAQDLAVVVQKDKQVESEKGEDKPVKSDSERAQDLALAIKPLPLAVDAPKDKQGESEKDEDKPTESVSERAQDLALADNPLPLATEQGFESDDEEPLQLTLDAPEDKQDESEKDESGDESGDETDDDDMDNGARGTVKECWGCRNPEFVKDNGLCHRCDKKHFNCAICGELNFCDLDTRACHECRLNRLEMEKRVRSKFETESEDDSEEDVTPVKPAEDGRWYCHDPDCDKSCAKKQDLQFHIMGDARGGHGARFDENHPLRWRNGALFIEPGWDPYTWKCDHCDDYNGFCKGYVNRGSLTKHFRKVHPELPLPEKRPKTPSTKRKRRLEGPSVLNSNYEIQSPPSPKRRKEGSGFYTVI